MKNISDYEILKTDLIRLPLLTDIALREAIRIFEKSQTDNPVENIQIRYGSLLIAFLPQICSVRDDIYISSQTINTIAARFHLTLPKRMQLKTTAASYVNYFKDLLVMMNEREFPSDCPLNKKQLTIDKVMYLVLADIDRPLINLQVEDTLEEVFTVLSKNLGFSEKETKNKRNIYFPKRNEDDFTPFEFNQLNLFTYEEKNRNSSNSFQKKIIKRKSTP